ncbi:MAG: ABC transporter substrate-binding protein [Chloroflexota bacterium]
MRIRISISLVAIIMAFYLSACASPVPDGSGSESMGASVGEAGSTGGTLTIGLTQALDNFDPHWNQLMAYQNLVAQNVFDHLTIIGPDMTVRPGLAERWEISADGTEYTFYLRSGATFHNGRAVTAADVVFSFNRTIDQEATFASKMEPIETIEAVDDQTVKMVLKRPVAPWPEEVSLIAIVSEESSDDLEKAPVGSGPFTFVEWIPNDRIVLAKNPDYDLPDLPQLDQIVLKILPDMAVALTNLESGEVDVVFEVPAADAERFKGRDDIAFQTPPSSNSIFVIEIAPNRDERLQDVRVRRALFTCMDKDAIRQAVYFGEGDSQWSPLPQSSWAYTEGNGPGYDPDTAKALLAEAGYAEGLELTIETISGVAVMENMATIWQENLAECGVTLNINISDISTWLDAYVNRDYQLIANWANYRSDPHGIFDVMYGPHWKDENSFPREDMLDLMSSGASSADEAERKEIYAQIQQAVIEDMAPVITVQSQPLIALTKPSVKNWTMNAMNYIFFNEIYVEE